MISNLKIDIFLSNRDTTIYKYFISCYNPCQIWNRNNILIWVFWKTIICWILNRLFLNIFYPVTTTHIDSRHGRTLWFFLFLRFFSSVCTNRTSIIFCLYTLNPYLFVFSVVVEGTFYAYAFFFWGGGTFRDSYFLLISMFLKCLFRVGTYITGFI